MPRPITTITKPLRSTLPIAIVALAACASTTEPPEGPPRKETVVAVNDRAELIRFNAGQPGRVLERKPLKGLREGDRLVGIDYRVARGVLYGLSQRGLLVTIDAGSGEVKPVGNGTALDFGAQAMGFDFNPAADRIRVVSADGRNWRLHPDTGALVQEDAALRYADGDAAYGQRATLAAAGYSYNKTNDKITTNYAIDIARGTLVRQGSLEGVQPVVSPNTGLLTTVGALGTGAVDDAAFDIADVGNTALAALRSGGRTRLHLVDLASGRASLIGSIDRGGPLWGMAIVP
jgi:Domain of unknown function (DUF4394)